MVAVLPAQIEITPAAAQHANAMEAVQRATYGEDYGEDRADTLRAWHFRRHVEIFPEGQFVAVDAATGQIVGHTNAMRIHADLTRPFLESWVKTTGSGWLTTHAPDGEWMYGVESCVHPAYQGHGVGKRLMTARLATAARLNLRGMIAGSTIMGYHRFARRMSAEAYVCAVVAGRLFDNNLSKQLKMGFRVLNIIPNYVSDESSLGWGAAIVWENPAYSPVSSHQASW